MASGLYAFRFRLKSEVEEEVEIVFYKIAANLAAVKGILEIGNSPVEENVREKPEARRLLRELGALLKE